MAESEDATRGKNVAKTKTSSEFNKGSTITPSGQVSLGDRVNASNNTIDSLESTYIY